MSQMCPNCSHDNPDQTPLCGRCQAPLRRLLGRNTMLDSDRYQITQVLGCGGFGAVYLAYDKRISGRKVAIKENRPDSTANPQAVAEAKQQFAAEVNLMIHLRHIGLPNVSDQFTSPAGYQYMVMDYIEGETLEDIVERRNALSEAEVVKIAKQTLEVLTYLHSQHSPIFHRDVKPANIKCQPDGRVVLVDLGIAKVHGKGTQSWAKQAGTPGFAPLEQYGRGATDARSDLYSLGAVMYYLLTAQVPPAAPDLASGTPLPPPRKLRPDLSLEIQRVIFKAMAVNAEDRYQSAAEMDQALDKVSQPSPVPPPVEDYTSTPVTRSNYLPWFAAIGGIGGTLACLALFLTLLFNSEILSPTPTATESIVASISQTPTTTATPTKTGPSAIDPTWTPTLTPPSAPTWTTTPTPEPAATWTSTPVPVSPTFTPTPDYEPTIEAIVWRYSNEIKIENTTDLNPSSLSQVLIDPVLEKQKRSACWLENEGFHYEYDNRSFTINSITFDSDDHATILARIKENRKLVKEDGEIHRDYGYDDYRAIYQLVRKNDRWYIYCFQGLDDDEPPACEVKIEGENPCE